MRLKSKPFNKHQETENSEYLREGGRIEIQNPKLYKAN